MAQLWEKPLDLQCARPLRRPVGRGARARSPRAYTFVEKKQHGTNPGVTVTDAAGREWHVKQPPHNHQGAEGPVEVVLSRVLSAVGYHQPPVYFLPSFTMTDADRHARRAGRAVPAEDRRARQARRLVVAAEPVRRHAAVSGTARHPADVRQLGSQERQQHALRNEVGRRRGAAVLVRGARSRHRARRDRPPEAEAQRSGSLRARTGSSTA